MPRSDDPALTSVRGLAAFWVFVYHAWLSVGPQRLIVPLGTSNLDLTPFADEAALLKDRKTWQRVLDVMKAGEMPPPPKPRPAASEAEAFTKLVTDAFERHDRTAKPRHLRRMTSMTKSLGRRTPCHSRA
jgi:hypothetical protein